ncbi:MAG: flavin reductase [Bacteroidales bacterium]|nr:flavin reductase [Bacteroidales bacterium]
MNNMNREVLNNLSYGLFVLSARYNGKDNACIINVVSQVTEKPLQIVFAVNKQNLTHDMVLSSKLCNISVLAEHTPMKVIEHFGFQSGKDVDKFEHCQVEMRSGNGLLYIPKYTNAYLSARVVNTIDMDTHTLFLAEVDEMVKLSTDSSLTYAFYHKNIKPKPVVAAAENGGKTRWVCKVCGYVYEGDELPDDFVCPWCKHGKDDFEKIV